MNEGMTKERLFDYFAGKATALERSQIDAWSRDSAHERQFYDWLDEWERAHLQYTADEPAALDRYRSFLAANPAGAVPAPPTAVPARSSWFISRRTGWWAVAASVAIGIGLFGFSGQLLTKTYTTGYGETRTLNLPDGSTVTLNANSSLRLSRFGFGRAAFGSPSREVRLRGEALFSVAHTPTHQRFVVQTDNGPEVVVLGTEFTVFARPRGTRVVLNRGRVAVRYQPPDHQLQQVTMRPGDRLFLSRQGDVRHQHAPALPTGPAWADHRFVFEQTPLNEIAATLGETYGLRVEIADGQTGQLTLSGAYPARNADELLSIIAEVLNLTITRQGSTVRLTPISPTP